MDRARVSLNIGGFGVQVGKSVWDVLAQKHGVNFEGNVLTRIESKDRLEHFAEKSNGRCIPIALFIDMDFEAIEALQTSYLKNLFYDEVNFAYEYNSAANNFARGYFSSEAEHLGRLGVEKFRTLHEENGMKQIIQLNALEGGTGSGFASLLGENLKDLNYLATNINNLNHVLYSSKHLSNTCSAPYNVALGYYGMSSTPGINFIYDNECLTDRISDQFPGNPTLFDINAVIAPVILQSISISPSSIVPFPTLNHLMAAHCPTASKVHEFVPTPRQLVNAAMNHESDLTSFAFAPFKSYMASCFIFEQKEKHDSLESMLALQELRIAYAEKFVPWSPNGVKTEYTKEMVFPRNTFEVSRKSLTAFFNTTATRQLLHHMMNQFDSLYTLEAFTFWYTDELMDMQLFKDAREHMNHVHRAYQIVFAGG